MANADESPRPPAAPTSSISGGDQFRVLFQLLSPNVWRSFWKNFNDRENARLSALPYLAMSRPIVKEEAFYEEHFIRHLAWMLCRLESSDVTSLGPELASGAAADRSDVYSGSASVKGWLFTSESLHPLYPVWNWADRPRTRLRYIWLETAFPNLKYKWATECLNTSFSRWCMKQVTQSWKAEEQNQNEECKAV